jgi:hypothetical protein
MEAGLVKAAAPGGEGVVVTVGDATVTMPP